MKQTIIRLVFLVCIFPCCGETFIVDPNGSADFTNIQSAIDYSWDGDTIVVRPGTYGKIKFNGRRITLTSLDPDDENIVNSTIIKSVSNDSLGTQNTVTFDFGEGTDSIITGFTIIAGAINRAIFCSSTAPTITKNRILSAYESYQGCSGTGISGCQGVISNNFISGCNSGIRDKGIICNNVIVGNVKGIYLNWGKPAPVVVIKNNIISNNSSYGLYCESGCAISNNSFNCFWNNTNNYGDAATAGTGDFWRNPLFAIDGHWSGKIWIAGDYHLKSTAGRWTATGWVLDGVDSPCIDKGDPSSSIGVEPNPNGGRINIGAYGGTLQASKSSSGIIYPVCIAPPSMDTNNDCKIDLIDFAEFASQWLMCGLDTQSACWE